MQARSRIVLIGPLKAGKSTVGRLLAEKLGWEFNSLDRLERQYTEPAGFDPDYARQIQESEGDWAWYSYRRQFFPAAIEAFLSDYQTGILELGGGHPIASDAVGQKRIKATLEQCATVILLVPSDDRLESTRLLRSRLRPEWQADNWNRIFLTDDRYWQLATLVVHTASQLPDETTREILTKI